MTHVCARIMYVCICRPLLTSSEIVIGDDFIIEPMIVDNSLVPRPPLAAFFCSHGKKTVFFHGCEKSYEGRPAWVQS